MITATCFGLLLIAAVLALAIQDSYWRGQLATQHETLTAGWQSIADEWQGHYDDAVVERDDAKRAARAALAAHSKARREADDNEVMLVVAAAEIDRLTLGQSTAKVLPIRGAR